MSATTPTVPTERIMTERNMTERNMTERIVNLEMAVAHLQHELEQMHTVLLALQTELKTARDQVSKLERRIVLVQEGEDNRNLDDERPPHY